jgi:sulfatase maturation enzyme AslB (radical SAM superfamily)
MSTLKPFRTIFFDISKICNAKCPYCITGRTRKKHDFPFISEETFRSVLEALVRKGYADNLTTLYLYVWGEPFLHSQFSSLLDIASDYPMSLALSTNASLLPKITPNFIYKVKSVQFSCSGFSQASYNRIHQFDFEKIKSNISELVKRVRTLGGKTDFAVNYHIYQFNQDELPLMRAFTQKLGIRFFANYAILNDWDLTQRWINQVLTPQEFVNVGSDLFNFLPRQLLDNAPNTYICPQKNFLVLDTNGDVCICCQTPHEKEFTIGSIFDDNVDEIIDNRQATDICTSCLASGCAYMFNNSISSPFWASSDSFWAKLSRFRKKIVKKFLQLI